MCNRLARKLSWHMLSQRGITCTLSESTQNGIQNMLINTFPRSVDSVYMSESLSHWLGAAINTKTTFVCRFTNSISTLLLQETVENCDIVAEATTPRPLLSTDEPICRTGETACSDRWILQIPSSSFFFLFRPRPVCPRTKSLGCFVLLKMCLPTEPPICIPGHDSLYNVTINSTAESCYPLHMSW